MQAYQAVAEMIDGLEQRLLAAVPPSVLALYDDARDQAGDATESLPYLTNDSEDDGGQQASEPVATAAAGREFSRGAARWGREHWDRTQARDALPAEFRPAGTGGTGGTDCTRFVSDAWHLGGGLRMDSQRKSVVSVNDWFSRLIGANTQTSVPWVRVTAFESTAYTDKIIQWSSDRRPGTPWNEFFDQRTPQNQQVRVRTRVVHYSG